MIIIIIIILIIIIIGEISTRTRTLAKIIVAIMVLETTTAPQLNNILQSLERCELAIGVGQRAADFSIAEQIPERK